MLWGQKCPRRRFNQKNKVLNIMKLKYKMVAPEDAPTMALRGWLPYGPPLAEGVQPMVGISHKFGEKHALLQIMGRGLTALLLTNTPAYTLVSGTADEMESKIDDEYLLLGFPSYKEGVFYQAVVKYDAAEKAQIARGVWGYMLIKYNAYMD